MRIYFLAIYYSTVQYIYFRDNRTNEAPSINVASYLQSFGRQKETWLTILIIASVLLLIILLTLLVLRKRINIAIALIKEGSK